MLFDSPVFFAFLLVVVPLYWLLNRRRQNIFLLLASYVFYGWWDWRFLGLILISTVVDFFCARAIAASDDSRKRKALLVLSLVVNLTFLGFFKYFNFFIDSLTPALGSLGVHVSVTTLRILLPPGISFYTFQEVAYIVDVYSGKLKPADSIVDYALFISLFPHLIAGPIQRPDHLLPQVQRERTFDAPKFFDGIMLIITGLFRKCVTANGCALVADAAFGGRFGPPSVVTVALGTYAFAWRIYGDFSGYSDIARGSAQLMGFHFMVNFRQPYLARSIQDFWRRWHISLSTWLRDYLYIPLGGNRRTETRTYGNLLTTMLIGGLWHGANWTFVVWGGIQGVGLAVERLWNRLSGRADPGESRTPGGASLLHGWWQRVIVFHFVCVAWVFFRATSARAAVSFLEGLGVWSWRPEFAPAMMYLVLLAVPLFLLDLLLEHRREEYPLAHSSYRARLLCATGLFVSVLLFSANQASAFIYFQF